MHRVITNVGSEKHVNIEALTAFESIAMSVVAILAVTLGTIYGSIL